MKMHIKSSKYKKTSKKYLIILLFICIAFSVLNRSSIKLNKKNLVNYLINQTTYSGKNLFLDKSKSHLKSLYNNPEKHILLLKNLIKKEPVIEPVVLNKKEKVVYIYNTHQTEEYAPTTFIEYSIRPTVMISNYIIQDILNENNYETIVEERSIKEILNNNKWNYASSYKASRIYLEDIVINNPNLKYFIDVHRDSISKDKTTTTINNKSYAKILFVVGLENPNYQKNLVFVEEINNCLNNNYPTLSKGIYKKQGPGVNGIYNQDFSPYTILVEMGGYENTINEVMNSSVAFSTCLLEVIKNH